jgi:dynein heavy chain, axonemal
VLKEAISKEEAIVQKAVDEANEIKMDCEKDLSEALPALEAAENALKVLSPADLTELKAMKQPP